MKAYGYHSYISRTNTIFGLIRVVCGVSSRGRESGAILRRTRRATALERGTNAHSRYARNYHCNEVRIGQHRGNLAKSYRNNCAHGTNGICPRFHSCLVIDVGFAGLNTSIRPTTNVNRAWSRCLSFRYTM